ncbi:ABC transporter ATP-binding protein [Devosia sp.]|uniref:ABC transporter ATP-binding protein n=1 Tax=Devosia sp. TaxID=1871048 RepID=UPI0025BF61A2|nr:ABC transporter ATP-binding protein [Devosia sp.]
MAADGDKAWVRIQGLDKSFDGLHALQNLDLEIGRGEFVSLLGPSGCGKTTTLRLIAGFETADAGSVTIAGQSVLAKPAHQRGMGVVFQNYALFPHLNAAENIAFGMRIARRPKAEIEQRIASLLSLVGLPRAGEKYPDQLSGGQQQRVAIARALAINPQMLLLDEPLSALDAVIRHELRAAIREIQQRLGVTTLFVTHDQEEALAISDRVIVMRDGRIEQAGTPEEVYARPATRFVADFIGRGNVLEGTVVDPRRGQVDLGDGHFALDPTSLTGVGAGAAIAVVVRPELMTLRSPEAACHTNELTGRITGSAFQGGSRHIDLETGSGLRIRASVPAALGGTLLPGSPIVASFTPDAAHVIVGAAA